MSMVLAALGMSEAEVLQTMEKGFGDLHTSAARLNYYPSADPVPDAERTDLTGLGDMALHHRTHSIKSRSSKTCHRTWHL